MKVAATIEVGLHFFEDTLKEFKLDSFKKCLESVAYRIGSTSGIREGSELGKIPSRCRPQWIR